MALLTFNWPRDLFVYPGPGGGGRTELPRDRELFWPSDLAVSSAGYTAPSAAGLVLARGVEVGWNPAVVLAVLLVLLVVVLLFHGDWFTLTVIVLTGLALALFLWRAGPQAQEGGVIALAWFLLLAGLRKLWQLAVVPAGEVVDFARLARRTGVPEGVWFFLFAFFAVFALVQAARWLLY